RPAQAGPLSLVRPHPCRALLPTPVVLAVIDPSTVSPSCSRPRPCALPDSRAPDRPVNLTPTFGLVHGIAFPHYRSVALSLLPGHVEFFDAVLRYMCRSCYPKTGVPGAPNGCAGVSAWFLVHRSIECRGWRFGRYLCMAV
ncbi:hypothetical protein FS749_008215, partial [Ceratobasidium sp. UAMH 11750]